MASRPLSGTRSLLSSEVAVARGHGVTRTPRGAGSSASEGSTADGAPRAAVPTVAPGLLRREPRPAVGTAGPPSFMRGSVR